MGQYVSIGFIQIVSFSLQIGELCQHLQTNQTAYQLRAIGMARPLAYFGLFTKRTDLVYLHVFSLQLDDLSFDINCIHLTNAKYSMYSTHGDLVRTDTNGLYANICNKPKQENKMLYVYEAIGETDLKIYSIENNGTFYIRNLGNTSYRWMVALGDYSLTLVSYRDEEMIMNAL